MSPNALFTPVKVGNLTLNHRVVQAPATRFRANLDATPSDLMVEYYSSRASEGGLLITEATFISPLAGSYTHAPGIYNKDQIAAWKKVTNAVHAKKGYIYLQLWHVGRAGAKALNPNNEDIVSASDIPISGKNSAGDDFDVPHPLTVEEIKAIQQDYAQAAKNAMEAGFDGVEILGAMGYLIDQFIETSSNKRTDNYGGSIDNRVRFALEVLDAVVGAVGAERTAIRFSPGGTFQDMHDDTEVETFSYLTSEIQKRQPNLSYLHFIEARTNTQSIDKTLKIDDSLEPYRKIWNGPFITAGGFSNAIAYASEHVEKTGDLIAFGRAFIANPDLPLRLENGYELNDYDRSTFYTYEPKGYNDYPFYKKN